MYFGKIIFVSFERIVNFKDFTTIMKRNKRDFRKNTYEKLTPCCWSILETETADSWGVAMVYIDEIV